jgi:hypothetical protein
MVLDERELDDLVTILTLCAVLAVVDIREVSFLHLLSGYCCDSSLVALGGNRRERVRGKWGEY